jgi:hypothetical protein
MKAIERASQKMTTETENTSSDTLAQRAQPAEVER